MTIQWTIFPSEKAAERKRRELFAQSADSVWLGGTIFSLPHFLKTVTAPSKPILTRNLQKHFIFYCLKKYPLTFFEKLKHFPSLANSFLGAIRQLKRFCLSPSQLDELLKETGSLKEYDLLKTYERYETLKKEKNVLDEEDLYQLPMQNNPPANLVFENFFELPPALKMNFKKPTIPAAQTLQQAQLFSLPSPHQETDWFLMRLQELLSQGVPIHEIGIFMGGPSKNYDPIWKKLKAMGLAQGATPFLTWRERPEGRSVLTLASGLPLEEASLSEWLDLLLSQLGASEISNMLGPFCFLNHALDIGNLSRQEFLEWLKENLGQAEQPRVPEALKGIQWIAADGGDTPLLKYLWIPQMLEGKFPTLLTSPFFQDKKDRSRNEWKIICEAFPESKDFFEKRRDIFLFQTSLAKHAWLTFPRRDSFGQDAAPSPFTWDFKEEENVSEVAPLFFEEEADLRQKLKIERERLSDDLKTEAFHTNFKTDPILQRMEPQKKEHIFSPSRLETYAECPFKYFAGRILQIPQEKEYSPQVDPDDRGTLFHNCLEKLLKEHGPLFLQAREDIEKEKLLFETLSEVVNTVFQEMAEQLAYSNPSLYQHLKEKTRDQAITLLQNEMQEAKNISNPLTPTYFEWGFGTATEKSLDIGDIRLGGRIDRIDISPTSKHFLVLDYKTGQTAKFREKLLEGLSLQLPIYVMAVQKLLLPDYAPIGGMLISMRLGERKYGIIDNQFNEAHYLMNKRSAALLETPDLEQTIATTLSTIKQYVQQIREGYFSAQPKDCKTSCDYKNICRYPHKPFE